ncbi:hypothetical protein [Vibrio sp. AND4]|uniref:hypothetical protein n=1 Tax=Vibrio sp. AND4 TaxID=314289 RepID=UPI00015EFB63|nr:hypothetical protein [Vibrio sp. AND4]EDP60159.1 hypothetical protein AND4_02083 [Vibrio sp. AND4]
MNKKINILGMPLAIISISAFSAEVNVSRVTESDTAVLSLLNQTVDRIVDSYGHAYIKIVSLDNFQKNDVERGVKRIADKSIARFEYQYIAPNGESITRVYHSFSGETPTPKLEGYPVDFRQKIEAEMRENERLVTGKITKEEYNSSGRYFRASNFDRANDAEIKALRRIERDIMSNELPTGGNLTVFVNQLPCESCRPLFEEQLAAWPHIAKADVSYLGQIPQNFKDPNTNDWYQYMRDHEGLAVGDEAKLQVKFTTYRKTRTKYSYFKKHLFEQYNIENGTAPATGCAL